MLLSPGEEARVGRMVANYLVIGVWGQGGQMTGLARIPASSPPCTGAYLLAGLTVLMWLLRNRRRWCRRARWWGSFRYGCGLAHGSTWRGWGKVLARWGGLGWTGRQWPTARRRTNPPICCARGQQLWLVVMSTNNKSSLCYEKLKKKILSFCPTKVYSRLM